MSRQRSLDELLQKRSRVETGIQVGFIGLLFFWFAGLAIEGADGVRFELTVPLGHAGFQDRSIKPLCHPSGCGLTTISAGDSLVEYFFRISEICLAAMSDHVTHFFSLGVQVFFIVRIRGDLDGDLLGDYEAVSLEAHDFFWVVGQQSDAAHTEVEKDLGAHAVFPEVGGVAELYIGLDSVVASLLQFVGVDFGGNADAPTLLAHVEENAGAFLFDPLQGKVELGAAVAAAGAEDIACETFAMHAHQHGSAGRNFTFGQGDMVLPVREAVVEGEIELAKGCGHFDSLFAHDEFFGASPVLDEVLDRGYFQVVFACKRN